MRRRGTTRLEIMVVASVTGVLLLVASGMGGALRGSRQLAQCQARLRQIGQLSGIVAGGDAKMIPHRQSTAGANGWYGLGARDWGGADGRCGETNGNWPYGPNLGASTRPYNHAFFGSPVPPNTDFSVFSCPADLGAVTNADYVPDFFSSGDDCTVDEHDIIFQSTYQAFGTSFQGDFLWWSTTSGAQSGANRFGSFCRPYERFTKPNETLLYYEIRMAQAMLSTDEWVNGGGAGLEVVAQVPSWHASSGHNSLMVDGHVMNITINVTGSLVPPNSFDPTLFPYRQSVIRGTGWRYDVYPESFVTEWGPGDPTPGSLVDGSGERLHARAKFVQPVD